MMTEQRLQQQAEGQPVLKTEWQRLVDERDAALAERDALQVVRDQMADGIMRCIDASWSGTRSMDWTHPELILAEYVGDMQATLTRLQQEREGLVAWQPISTAPTDGTTVLLTDGHYVRTGYYARRINVWSVDTTVALPLPTRWCTIPPPTETQEPQS